MPRFFLRTDVLLWLLVTIILIGTPLLAYPVPRNAGMVSYLFAPLLLAMTIPLSCALNSVDVDVILKQILFHSPSLLLPLIFVHLLYKSPLLIPCLKGILFLWSFCTFLIGVHFVLRSIQLNRLQAQVCSTSVGILLNLSFLILSPVIRLYEHQTSFRENLINLATQGNPVLILSGSILKKDFLRGTFMYEHILIGKYYNYTLPDWRLVAGIYLTVGMILIGITLLTAENITDPNTIETSKKDAERDVS